MLVLRILTQDWKLKHYSLAVSIAFQFNTIFLASLTYLFPLKKLYLFLEMIDENQREGSFNYGSVKSIIIKFIFIFQKVGNNDSQNPNSVPSSKYSLFKYKNLSINNLCIDRPFQNTLTFNSQSIIVKKLIIIIISLFNVIQKSRINKGQKDQGVKDKIAQQCTFPYQVIYDYKINQAHMTHVVIIGLGTIHEQIITKSNYCTTYKVRYNGSIYIKEVYTNMLVSQFSIIKQLQDRWGLGVRQLQEIRTFSVINRMNSQLTIIRPQLGFNNLFRNEPKLINDKRQDVLLEFTQKVFKGKSFYLYSYESSYYKMNQNKFSFNPTSTGGLQPILVNRNFTIHEFLQGYELLDQEMFTEAQSRQSLVTYKSKFRAIGMFVLHIIFGRRVTLLNKGDIEQDQISLQEARKLVEKVPDKFRRFFQRRGVSEMIKKAEEKDTAKYMLFLRRVFEDNCKDLEWKQAASLLFNQQKPKSESDEKLRTPLKNLAEKIFLNEDEYSRKALVQLGIAKYDEKHLRDRKHPEIQLIDKDIYLLFLLKSASFKFGSVAGQISQKKQTASSSNLFTQLFSFMNRNALEQTRRNQLKKSLKLSLFISNEPYILEPTSQYSNLNDSNQKMDKTSKFIEYCLYEVYKQENGPYNKEWYSEPFESIPDRKVNTTLSPENLQIVKQLCQDNKKVVIEKNESFTIKLPNQNMRTLKKFEVL